MKILKTFNIMNLVRGLSKQFIFVLKSSLCLPIGAFFKEARRIIIYL